MRRIPKDILRLLLPAFLVVFALALDFRFFSIAGVEELIQRPRAFLLIPLVAFVYWAYSRNRWIREKPLMEKFRFLFMAQIIVFVVFKIIDWAIFDSMAESIGFDFIQSTGHVVQTACYSIVFLALVGVFIALRDLIYIKQGKRTSLFFILLLTAIGAKLLAAAVDPEAWTQDQGFMGGGSLIGKIVLAPFCVFAVINAFRCKWIHYLNRRQKLRIFFVGLILLPLTAYNLGIANRMINEYHAVLGVFIWTILCFYLIYLSVGLFAVLLHLPSSGIMDQRSREIQSLQTLISTLGSIFSKEELIPKTMDMTSTMFDGDFAWMELGHGQDRQIVGIRNVTRHELDGFPIEAQIAIHQQISSKEKVILLNDLAKDSATKSIRRWSRKAGSLLAARLEVKNQSLGYLFVVKEEAFGFAEEDRALFRAFAEQVSISMENCRLVRVSIERETYHEELRLAHDAQMRLLPQKLPSIPGVDMAGFCVTANEIGGDFYDVIPGKDRIDFVIGDVAGKGASAAFHMAELKGMVRSLAHSGSTPKQIVVRMNDLIYGNLEPGMFTTLVYGVLTPSKRRYTVVRAGHPPAILIRKGQVTSLEMKGTGLGMIPSSKLEKILEEKTLVLKNGDTIFACTDGLIEALDPHGNEFGEKAIAEFLLEQSGERADALLNGLRDRVMGFIQDAPRHDDITAVVFQIGNKDHDEPTEK